MKKFAIPALAAALALGACSETNTTEVVEADTDGTTAEAPVASETTVVVDGETTPSGDKVTINEDGVTADITDGDTRVKANVDGDPSLTVETD